VVISVIVGTPVIDTTTNTIYFVSRSVDITTNKFSQFLHALDITTGNESSTGHKLLPQQLTVMVMAMQMAQLTLIR